MKLENQVVSLDLAKRLKELGVKQESFFYWDKHGDNILYEKGFAGVMPVHTSAFTVAELGEMLKPGMERSMFTGMDKWRVVYHPASLDEPVEVYDERCEANARAKMLIYLLENGLLSDNK